MQDRFKFRVWNKEYSKLYTWEDIIDKKGNCSLYWCMLQAQNDEANNILMQCTGLKDKNGKLIYEGDIVKNGLHNDLVEWYKGGFWVNGFINGAKWNIHYSHQNLEVIGNIYENPELLESN